MLTFKKPGDVVGFRHASLDEYFCLKVSSGPDGVVRAATVLPAGSPLGAKNGAADEVTFTDGSRVRIERVHADTERVRLSIDADRKVKISFHNGGSR